MKICYVYIKSNDCRTTLITGLADNLQQIVNTETTKNLLYFERFQNLQQAIKREKQLRNWKTGWKIELIRRMNPCLKNLAV